MNVNFSSGASSAASSVWSLLASRAAAASNRSTSFGASSDSAVSTADGSTGTARPDGPPPSPSQFDCAMSTAQFAGMGRPPGGDPIASLDADDDGNVSSDEFGLDDASKEVQQLFAAIDADGSGGLSTDEIDGFREQFREQMMAADGERGEPPPMGPPPAQAPDVSRFLQQLAQRYASLMADDEADVASTVSATA